MLLGHVDSFIISSTVIVAHAVNEEETMTSEAGSTSGPVAGPVASPATGPTNGLAIRPDLVEAHENAWARIAAPGTWLSGAVRVEVAAEVRQATDCRHCVAIKSALSPYGVLGKKPVRCWFQGQ